MVLTTLLSGFASSRNRILKCRIYSYGSDTWNLFRVLVSNFAARGRENVGAFGLVIIGCLRFGWAGCLSLPVL